MAGKGKELAEQRWYNEVWEFNFVKKKRGESRYLKTQAHRAARRQKDRDILKELTDLKCP